MKTKEHNRKLRNIGSGQNIRRLLFGGITILSLTLFSVPELKCQYQHFSQFFAIPLFLGPSFSGEAYGTRINAVYRNQWPQIKQGFVTYGFSIDQNISELNSGIGLQVTRDQRGEVGLNNTNFSLNYSYDIVMRKKLHIRPGLMFAYVMGGVDYSKLRMRDQIVLATPVTGVRPQYSPHNYPDAALSFLAYTDKYWFGTKIDHLMRPLQIEGGSTRIPLNYSVYGGILIHFKDRFHNFNNNQIRLAFNLLATASFYQMDMGIIGIKRNIEMGFWYRGVPAIKQYSGSDAFILSLGYIFETFRIGYSHDFTVSCLNTISNGADEITITYIFKQAKDANLKKAVQCTRALIK